MKIVDIFVIIDESLLSVKYDGTESDEFSHLMNCWRDIEYLRTFFKTNQKYLTNGFFGTLTIDKAIQITLGEAEILERILLEKAEQGKESAVNNLQTIFKALDDNEYSMSELQKNKLKGNLRKSWLRIYAIRIGPNMFVISGGGIKLTPKMEDSEHLKLELHKLEITKNYLKNLGILDENDYELLEI